MNNLYLQFICTSEYLKDSINDNTKNPTSCPSQRSLRNSSVLCTTCSLCSSRGIVFQVSYFHGDARKEIILCKRVNK